MTRTQRMIWAQRLHSLGVQATSHALCLPVALSCLFPMLWMVASSLKTQQTVFRDFSLVPIPAHFSNYVVAWTKGRFGIYFLNSLCYTSIVVVGVLTLSSLAAYAFSKFTFKGSGFLHKLLL